MRRLMEKTPYIGGEGPVARGRTRQRPATSCFLATVVLLLGSCALDPVASNREVAADDGCASCHAEQAADARRSMVHAVGTQGCGFCHAPHDGSEPVAAVRVRCEECHAEVVAQFRLPFQHPLGGSVTCTSCHLAHGGSVREVREHQRRDACVECHLEFSGPFLFEHEGDRGLQCLSCHEPHGSSNPRLLTHHDSRSLCHSCHMHLEDIHLENPGSIFRDCLLCHSEIHGSNWDREFLR